MYFKNLPDNIKEAITKLVSDDVFQQRFGTDKILDDIEQMKIDKQEQLQMFLAVTTGEIIFNGKHYPMLTPAEWSFLWIINSPIVTNIQKTTKLDIDFFLYVIFNGVGDGDIKRIQEECLGYCEKIFEFDYDTASKFIIQMLRLSFRPLKLFPVANANAEKMVFDADWLTSIVTKVHKMTGYTPDFILESLPLCVCCYYFAQYARQQGSSSIHRRTDEEILILQAERTVDLICDRLIELNVFPVEDRNKYRQIMLTKPDNQK